MAGCRILRRGGLQYLTGTAKGTAPGTSCAVGALKGDQGSAILEFAIVLPLLVVFVVGIYDFSAAFNQKQKIEQAAQEGAIIAGAQPMSDIQPSSNPASLLPVVAAVVNSLSGSGVVANGTCGAHLRAPVRTGLAWTYTISGCSGSYLTDSLVIVINRGWVCGPGTMCVRAARGRRHHRDRAVSVSLDV